MKRTKTKIKNKISEFLKKNNIKHSLLSHKKVFTAFDEAETQGKKLGEIAKAVLVKAEKELALIVVPAGKYVDFKNVKKALKAKKVSIAKELDITNKLKTKIGLLHAFGNLYGSKGNKITTLLDDAPAQTKKKKNSSRSSPSHTK